MKLDYIDIHSHLNLSPLSENREAVLAKMKELGVGTITVGTGLETSKMAIAIAEENPDMCWATIGIHPTDGDEPFVEEFLNLASHEKVVAIGETGLDYFRDQSIETKEKQTELFKKHIVLAQQVNKPLMLHVRASKGSDDAYFDALEILKNSAALRANFHFFSGSKICMEAIVSAGFTVSVDGPITFSHDYDDMIRAVPLDKIMIETDAPFAAPAPYRGKPCEPWMVVEVAKKVAELKGLGLEVLKNQLLENASTFFGIECR
jgi:TatD DNase family protein